MKTITLPILLSLAMAGSNGLFAQKIQAPINDDCANATTLNVGTICSITGGDFAGATESIAPYNCNGDGAHAYDLWYKFTATDSKITTTAQLSDTLDAVIILYDGCAGNVINCSDILGYGDKEEIKATNLTVGATYYVRVYPYDTMSVTTDFTICSYVTPAAPLNDDCINATTINMVSSIAACSPTNVNTTNATQSSNEASCLSASYDDDVWYSFNAIANAATINISNKSIAGEVGMVIYADSCNGNEIECIAGITSDSIILLNLTTGNKYYIRTFYYGTSDRGTFDLCVYTYIAPPPPSNDDCVNATLLTVGTTCTPSIGNVSGATESLPGCQGNANDDIWYKFIATATDQTIEIVGLDQLDPVVEIFAGGCSGTSLYCDDETGSGGMEKIKASNLTVGDTYYIRVYDYFSNTPSSTNFNICVYLPAPPPANDECANAIDLPVVSSITSCSAISVNTSDATQSVETSSCFSTSFDDDVWYKFTSNIPSIVIKASNLSFSSGSLGYVIYKGTCSGPEIICTVGDSLNIDTLTVGATYYLRTMYTGTSNRGTFDLCAYNYAPNSINKLGVISFVNIYPNPISDNFTLNYTTTKSEIITYNIIDLTGKTVKSIALGNRAAGNYTEQVDVKDLAKGTYLLNLVVGEQIVRKKISVM